MKIETGGIVNLAACAPDWVVAFRISDEVGEDVCPVIGWATVVEAHMSDGTTSTAIQPAFLYVDMVWTPTELRDHNPIVSGFEIRAREIPGAAARTAMRREWEAVLAPRPAREAAQDTDDPDRSS